MVNIEDKTFKSILDTIKKVNETSQTEYTGKITEVMSGNKKAKVKMPNENTEFTFLNKTGETLFVGDSVIIKAINGNLSNAYISLRFGESTSEEMGYASTTSSGIINSTNYTYLTRTYNAGSYSSAIGVSALQDNVGFYNIGIGTESMLINTSGQLNTAVGFSSLRNNKIGNRITAIGAFVDVNYDELENSTIIGNSAKASASNQITLGNGAITSLRCAVTSITALSDTRIKEDIELANKQMCLETVLSLPVNRYKYKDFTGTHLDKHVTGWLADDVEKIFPKAVQVSDEMFNELDENGNIIYDENGEPKRFKMDNVKNITMSEAIPTLWGAVQRLYEIIGENNGTESNN